MNYKNELLNELDNLVSLNSVSNSERILLNKAIRELNDGVYLLRVIKELKRELSLLAWKKELTSEVLQFFSELSRRNPTTGVGAMWNFLIRRKE